MEWVETVAKSVEAAKSAALDRLGVAEDEADFEVLSTPKPGLFGRVRGEARVRARVRPASVRPKTERRRRGAKNRSDDSGSAERRGRGAKKSGPASGTDAAVPGDASDTDPSRGADSREDDTGRSRRRRGGGSKNKPESRNGSSSPDTASSQTNDRASTRSSQSRRKESTMSAQDSASSQHDGSESPVTPDEVATAAVSFLEGLAGAFGVSATGSSTVDGTDIEVQLNGDDLGLLIGPAGGTLQAVQDLTRVVAQRKLGDHSTRLRVDIAQYRERRRVALEKFATAVSEQVIESQRPRALEPMSAADRKVIHDVVQTIDGVESTSDGSDPNRRVVITPASAGSNNDD